jgi:type 1 glutamine amidotransferase
MALLDESDPAGNAVPGEAPCNLINTVTSLPGHPLTDGAEPFTLQDEHYHMTLDDEGEDVFLTMVSEHGERPGGWRRNAFWGRIAVLTPGHNLVLWQHPAYQRLILNTARWCGYQD